MSSNTPELPGRDPSDSDDDAGTIPLRPVAIIAGILLVLAIGYLGYSCVRSSSGGSSFADQVSHYALNSVSYIAPARTYLVRQADGTFLALSEIEATQTDRVAGCVIRYRPDLSAAGAPGAFRDDCHGVLFDRGGQQVDNPAAPMQRHLVVSDGKTVSIHYRVCLNGSSGREEACRE